MNEIQKFLFAEQDLKYKDFISKHVPNVDKENIIGVRMPKIRAISKLVLKDKKFSDEFLVSLPHKYYEENILHSCMISALKDCDQVLEEIDKFLPYVDNWAVCDSISPKVLRKNSVNLAKFYDKVAVWSDSNDEYVVRFACVALLNNFVGENFDATHLDLIYRIFTKPVGEHYYVKMAAAWYISVLLMKNYVEVIHVLEENLLPVWVHNKSIQKAVESYQISDETKLYLKSLRKKK